MRHFVIGDIHGCLKSLKNLVKYLEAQGLGPRDTIITLGDYIDRGPDTKGVIDYLIDLKKKYRVICLKGNHEELMEYARESKQDLEFWIENGGQVTLDSFGVDNVKKISGKYWDFIISCFQYHETSHHIFVHAGLKSNVPLNRQHPNILFWQRLRDSKAHMSGKTVICGHSPQDSGVPINLGHTIGIDTYAFADLWLTCLDPVSGEFWQANEFGDRQKGNISELKVPLPPLSQPSGQ